MTALQQATNTTFTLDKNCVDQASVQSSGDQTFNELRKGFGALVAADAVFSVVLTSDMRAPQPNDYVIAVVPAAIAQSYPVGTIGNCTPHTKPAPYSEPQIIAHELYHHFPVASGGHMSTDEDTAITHGDNVYNAAAGRPLRCSHNAP